MAKFLDDLVTLLLHLMLQVSRAVAIFRDDYGTAWIVIISIVVILAIYWVASQFWD